MICLIPLSLLKVNVLSQLLGTIINWESLSKHMCHFQKWSEWSDCGKMCFFDNAWLLTGWPSATSWGTVCDQQGHSWQIDASSPGTVRGKLISRAPVLAGSAVSSYLRSIPAPRAGHGPPAIQDIDSDAAASIAPETKPAAIAAGSLAAQAGLGVQWRERIVRIWTYHFSI